MIDLFTATPIKLAGPSRGHVITVPEDEADDVAMTKEEIAREKRKAYEREYYLQHREKRRAQMKAVYEASKDKYRERARKRARKLRANNASVPSLPA